MASKHRNDAGKSRTNGRKKASGASTQMLAIDLSAFVLAPARGAAKRHDVPTLRFGSVQASLPAPDPDALAVNIATGQAALKRAKAAFLKPGVILRHKRNVPVFAADPHDPSILIRTLNGRAQRVRLIDGAFTPAE